MNRLAGETSPYLLQHKHNPVDWLPWGEQALARARELDRPLLVSIGYSACHWCHVMERESFEDDQIAALMNEHFVCVKVDREERPDVDAIYMEAVQAMTGSGGWPLNVFITPEQVPFYAGTYFPPEPRQGMPSWPMVLGAVAEAWDKRRNEIREQSAAIAGRLAGAARLKPAAGPLDAGILDEALQSLAASFDVVDGGWGTAPKFPAASTIEFLLRRDETAMALQTLRSMASGGIYDQIGGGFARYSVDAHWTVPHFEKMLYDNALLLRAYTELWRLTEDPFAKRIADETAAFLLRDLGTPQGGLASALDADAAGVEGLTYAWTPTQLVEVLGDEDGAWAADLFRVTEQGTFEHGSSVLVLGRDIDAAEPSLVARWSGVREKLLHARAARPQPARDDKVVASWNGLAVTAVAEHGMLTGAAESVEAAIALAD